MWAASRTKKWKRQSYNHKELGLAKDWNEVGCLLITRASREEDSPAETLVLTL